MSTSPQIGRETLDAIRAAVSELPSRLGPVIDKASPEPIPGSQAWRELEGFEDSQAVRSAYSQGSLLIESAADHMFALRAACEEPVTVFAPWTLTRAVLEASARAQWLLDHSIDVKTRVERSMTMRLSGLENQRKLPDLATFSDRDRIDQRVLSVLEAASARQIDEKRSKRKKERVIGFGDGMPGSTGLVAQVLDAEAEYRLASGVAHADPSILIPLGFAKSDKPNLLEKHTQPISIVFVCMRAIEWFSRPVWS